VTALACVRIATVAAGESFTHAVSEAGGVFSFGKGRNGRLGHGNTMDQKFPKQIEALQGVCVLTIAAGKAHALALTRTGASLLVGMGGRGSWGMASGATTPRL
jgi:alpha-tubulin suppressor-like RCC1 family protein